MQDLTRNKVVIIGAGAVGSTYAYTLMVTGAAYEIVLVDVNRELAEGNAMDLQHGLFFTPPVDIRVGDYSDCEDADIVLIAAGSKQRPGQTRLELASTNAYIMRDIVRHITRYTSDAILLVVTNPVDVLTWVALKESGYHKERVIGSGTLLDSARLRYFLSNECGVDARNIHAQVIGEHGDSEVIAWSLTHIGGVDVTAFRNQCLPPIAQEAHHQALASNVKDSAYHIIEAKGLTNYAVSLALQRITTSILRDERSVLTVSTYLEGEYGLEDVCLSVPVLVGRHGAERVIVADLAENELAALRASGAKLRKLLEGLP